MIGILDYGFGNLTSVLRAFKYLGHEAKIINSKDEINNCDKILLPGVGAFEDAMKALKDNQFDIELKKHISKNKPIMGICLGMQLLFDKSYENGTHVGLSFLEGDIVKLCDKLKIPQIGWNSLNIKKGERLFKDIPENSYVYFVHSYYLETKKDIVSTTTEYGKEISVSVEYKNIFGTQFHPEKSGEIGLKILNNFANI